MMTVIIFHQDKYLLAEEFDHELGSAGRPHLTTGWFFFPAPAPGPSSLIFPRFVEFGYIKVADFLIGLANLRKAVLRHALSPF
jgi:hypothetical protein